MRPWERRSFNVMVAAVTATGVIYFWMKYLLATDDPFAIVNHPWEGPMLSLHVVTAPVLIWLFGIVFRAHTLTKLRSKLPANRRSGWSSLLSFVGMALSGYLLQVVSHPAWIPGLVVLHVVTSLVFVVGYLGHLVVGWRLAWTNRPARDSGTARLAS